MQTGNSNKRNSIVAVVAVIAIISAILWFGSQKTEDVVPIRIATIPWPGYEPLHLAQRKGFFEEEGAPIELVRFSTLEDSRRAYERGQVDGMAVTLIELLQAHENGHPAQVALMTDSANGSDVIIARKGINSISGLKGKKIGVEPPFSIYSLFLALQKAGLSLDDVKMVNMNQLKMPAALLSGRVDAVHTYAPYSTEILRHPDQVGKVFQVPSNIIDIVVLNPDIITHRLDDVRGLRRAWDKAVAYTREHQADANLLMADIEKISPAEFIGAMKGIKILSLHDQQSLQERKVLEKDIVTVGTILRKIGQVKESVPPENFIVDIQDTPHAHNN